jgi:hypothetical protein
MYVASMPVRSVQISVEEELLAEVDGRPETKRDGRSAVIKRALRLYLDQQRRTSIDEQYARGYGKKKATGSNELDELLGTQAWPDER